MKIFNRKGQIFKEIYNKMDHKIKDLLTKYLINSKRTAGMPRIKIGYIKVKLHKIITTSRF